MASGTNTSTNMLNQEQMEECLRIFNFYDFFDVDRVRTNYLGRIFTDLKIKISRVDLHQKKLEVDPQHSGSFSSNDFVALMSRMKQEHKRKRQQMQMKMECQPQGAGAGAGAA